MFASHRIQTKTPNGGVDAAARIKAPFAGPSKLRNTLPPLASNDLLCRDVGTGHVFRRSCVGLDLTRDQRHECIPNLQKPFGFKSTVEVDIMKAKQIHRSLIQ